jgi:two-component system cell cycle response regulator
MSALEMMSPTPQTDPGTTRNAASATPAARVLVIEDDESVSRLLHRWLERSGWQVSHAPSLAAARPLLHEVAWDVLLLDRRLPDGDGVSLLREIRRNPAYAGRYVMILTGEASDQAKLEGFEGGADDYVTKPFQLPELMARIRAGLRIVTLQKALVASNDRLERLSNTDALTGLANKRFFETEMRRMFEHSARYDRPLSIGVLDVDHFKAFNDNFGHLTGDAVLRHVAEILRTCTRKSDVVARYGGEEFVIVMPETQLLEAVQVAEKVRIAVAERVLTFAGERRPVTVSIGVAGLPHTKFDTIDTLIDAADRALYRAKEAGRNRVGVERRKEASRFTLKCCAAAT